MKHYRIKVNKALSAKLQRLLPIIILLLAGMNAWAQTKQVSGVVTDGTGETVIGASVLEKEPRTEQLRTWTVNSY